MERALDEHGDISGDAVPQVTMHAGTGDGSAFSGTAAGVIAGGTLENERLTHLTLTLNIEYQDEVIVRLRHGTPAVVAVTGYDSTWVNGTVRRLEQFFARLPPQDGWGRFAQVALTSLAFVGGWVFAFLFAMTVLNWTSDVGESTSTPEVALSAVAGGVWVAVIVVGAWLGVWVQRRLRDNWPRIDLRTGPDHLDRPAQARRRLRVTWLVAVAPFLISVLSGVLVVLLS